MKSKIKSKLYYGMNGVNEGRTIVKFRRVPKLLYVSVHRLIHERHGHFRHFQSHRLVAA